MFNIYQIKVWLNWATVKAHICTVAVALCFNSTWRVPRDAFRYGGVIYGLVLTVAMGVVALPTALLHLSIGQLSQQDAVGMWRAVPFFKGVGYVRLLITCLASIYTIAYVGITTTLFFYSLTNDNSVRFESYEDTFFTEESNNSYTYNTSCANGTILASVQEQPEHYTAMALITLVLWVLFPVILYSPVKFMKNIYYGAVPIVLVLAITIISCLGDKNEVKFIHDSADWIRLRDPEIWYSAIIQSLWSTQIAGGYLISAGDIIYSCTDVQWTVVIFFCVNVLVTWFGLIFWFAIGGSCEKDTSVLAVLEQTFKLVAQKSLSAWWPPLIFVFMFSSGVITVLTLLYPLYERFKRIGGPKWRYLAAGSSLVGAGASLAALAVGLPALTVLDDTVVPILISVTTILEIGSFVFIYGWRFLIEDIEFLIGRDITKFWVSGWCTAIGIILSFTTWWLVSYSLNSPWVEPTWTTGGLIAAAGAFLANVAIFATISVVRQVQYDVIGKLKSSFRPSRHWGPRDPITHYYWLARRREHVQGDQPLTRYHRRQLGQLSGNLNYLNSENIPNTVKIETVNCKRRSNSDDWIYAYRKKNLSEMTQENNLNSKKRSKSLDLTNITNPKVNRYGHNKALSVESIEVASVKSTQDNDVYVKHL